MKRILFLLSLAVCLSAAAQDISWKQHAVDGHRSGVTQGPAGKTKESMGKVRKFGKYTDPNGLRHKKRSSARRVAKVLLKAQKTMEPVKEIIGHSPREMAKQRPECELTNWFIDHMMEKTAELTGKKVDIGLSNFGGVRTNMPDGDVYRDDIMSMFPFTSNTLYYFTMTGKSLQELLENMAARGGEIVGGLRAVFKDKKLVEATVGGEPIDPERIYGVATINFLMEGNGWFRFGKYQIEGIDTKVPVMDVMLKYVEETTRQGKPIEYKKDGRITIL